MSKIPKLPKGYSFSSHIDLSATVGYGKFSLHYQRWWMLSRQDIITINIYHTPTYNEKTAAYQELMAYAWELKKKAKHK
jgi:hypothetical protein